MEILMPMLFALLGTVFGSLLSILPGLHVLNFAGIGVALFLTFPLVSPLCIAMMLMGMLVGYAMVGTIATVFMGAPDDSTIYMAFPAQKYLMCGRGYEAAAITGMGALGGMLLLLLVAPISSTIFPIFRKLLTPHTFWILGGIIIYLLMSEWPKDWGSRAKTRLGRLRDGWASLSAGLLTFFLASMLGFLVMNRSVVPIDRAFQNIMPVFVGFFAVPWVLTNLISRVDVPPQTTKNTFYVSGKDIFRGTTSGFLGGMFAAYTPIITAGVGGVFAGHSTVTSGDVQFTVSGGAGRFVYYVGAFFLFWVPMLHLTRGGMGWISSIIYSPETASEFWLLGAGIAIAGVLAFFTLLSASRIMAKVVGRFSYRNISIVVLAVILAIVIGFTGWQGLVIMTVATGIGLIPVMFRSRRLNLMAVLLVPVFLNMAGYGAAVAKFLEVI